MPRPAAQPLKTPVLHLGFAAWTGQLSGMAVPHLHHEIELNLLVDGSVDYLIGGNVVHVTPGAMTLFWAAVPHQSINVQPPARCGWITIPLNMLLRWRLPESFVHALLCGTCVIDPQPSPHDYDAIARWGQELGRIGNAVAPDPTLRHLAELEIEARITRLALAWEQASRTRDEQQPATSESQARPRGDLGSRTAVETMASFIASNFADPIRIADIAQAAGLHPNYAMTLFRQQTGMTLVDYLTRQRIAHAQRLLATTETDITAIAFDAGFGSLSRFYEAFQQVCQQTPTAFRKQLCG